MELLTIEDFEYELNERRFSDERREELAKKGYAMPDGSFPIEKEKDVKNAVRAWGRSQKPGVKEHIIKRAKSLGVYDTDIPEDWK